MSGPRLGLYASLALVLVANAVFLAGAAWNRDAFDARVELTERELAQSWRSSGDTEMTLRFVWRDPDEDVYDATPWLDSEGLRSLGFDVSQPLDSPKAMYDRLLPRDAFVVLEMEGPAWRRWVEARKRDVEVRGAEEREDLRKGLQYRLDEDLQKGSRLVAVAAGRDARELRLRFPDRGRYLILPAEISLSTWLPSGSHFVLHGTAKLRNDHIAVPLSLRSRFELGHYRVTVATGRRFEPWLESFEPRTP